MKIYSACAPERDPVAAPGALLVGTVRHWFPKQGIGSVRVLLHGDYFVRREHVVDGPDLPIGARVAFVVDLDDRPERRHFQTVEARQVHRLDVEAGR